MGSMETRKTTKPYPAELRERAVRLVREQAAEHGSQWSAIRSIAEKVGCNAETLRLWVRRRHALRDRCPSGSTGAAARLCSRLSSLPWTVRFAEVDAEPGFDAQIGVLCHL